MATVEIYGIPRSSYTRVVRLVCEEKSIEYELKPVPPHAPEVTAIHPYGKIPVMRHGNLTLFESKAIATYLDRGFPGPKLIPDDPRRAALVEQWVSLFNTAMDGPLVRTYILAYIFPKGPDGKPEQNAIDAVVPTMRAQLQLLDHAVAPTGWLVGDGLTLADLYVVPILYYLRQFPESAVALKETPYLAAWYDRLAARPSFAKTNPPHQGLKR